MKLLKLKIREKINKKNAEHERKKKIKEERIKYIKESLTIVESSLKLKLREERLEESCECLKEDPKNSILLFGVEQRKKLRAKFHQKIRKLSIS